MAAVGGAPNVLDAVLALLFAFALVRGWRQGAVLQIGGSPGLRWACWSEGGRRRGSPGWS